MVSNKQILIYGGGALLIGLVVWGLAGNRQAAASSGGLTLGAPAMPPAPDAPATVVASPLVSGNGVGASNGYVGNVTINVPPGNVVPAIGAMGSPPATGGGSCCGSCSGSCGAAGGDGTAGGCPQGNVASFGSATSQGQALQPLLGPILAHGNYAQMLLKLTGPTWEKSLEYQTLYNYIGGSGALSNFSGAYYGGVGGTPLGGSFG